MQNNSLIEQINIHKNKEEEIKKLKIKINEQDN